MIVAAIIIADDTGFAQRQAFYDAVKAGDDKKAVEIGKTYLAAHPDQDAFALDVAYAELRAGDHADAVALFEKLEESTNPHVASTARQQLALLSGRLSNYGYAYNAVQYESRFNDIIFDGFRLSTISPGRSISISTRRYVTRTTPVQSRDRADLFRKLCGAGNRSTRTDHSVQLRVCRSGVRMRIGLGGQRTVSEVRYGVAGSRDFGLLNSEKPHDSVD